VIWGDLTGASAIILRKTSYQHTKGPLCAEQAFQRAIAANPVKRRINAPAASEVVAVSVEHVRMTFFRLCADASHEARRVAFARELSLQRREYPQAEDFDGTRWIWRRP
jgi:hypothetical protein